MTLEAKIASFSKCGREIEERKRKERKSREIKESPVFAKISSVQSGRNITRGILAENLNFSR